MPDPKTQVVTYQTFLDENAIQGTSDSFFEVFNSANDVVDESEQKDFFGWKLHLSVHEDDVERAYDLVAAILFKYSIAFKVVNIKNPTRTKRFIDGTQITVYLQQNSEVAVSLENVKAMLVEVHDTLNGAGILPGVQPQSDAKISDFFSIRNDCFFVMEDNAEPGYAAPNEVGQCYNPCNLDNPYVEVFAEQQKPFSVIAHYASFQAKDLESINLALKASLVAFQREYLLTEYIGEQDTWGSRSRPLSYKLKPQYQNASDIKGIVSACQRASSLLNRINLTADLHRVVDEVYRGDGTYDEEIKTGHQEFDRFLVSVADQILPLLSPNSSASSTPDASPSRSPKAAGAAVLAQSMMTAVGGCDVEQVHQEVPGVRSASPAPLR